MVLPNNLNDVIKKLFSHGYQINSVFDIGAHKGTWTTQYEKLLPNAQFSLFEANPNLLRPPKLAKKHKWFNVVLSDPETKEVEFYSIRGTGDSYYKEQTHAYNNCTPQKLQTTTLDQLARDHSLIYPQLIKLDTQGSELDILRGAESIINHVDIIVTEAAVLSYNRGSPSFDDYIKYFTALDFIPIGVEEIHLSDNTIVQFDIVFLKNDVKIKYYGDKQFLNKESIK